MASFWSASILKAMQPMIELPDFGCIACIQTPERIVNPQSLIIPLPTSLKTHIGKVEPDMPAREHYTVPTDR